VSEQKLIINPDWEHAQFVSIAELRECENKLEAANERIKVLNQVGNELRKCASYIGTVSSGVGSVIGRTEKAIQSWDKEAQ
jgi:hypothetical protein